MIDKAAPPSSIDHNDKPLTLLIADDEEFGREFLTVLAQAMNFKVIGAINGKDAIDKFQQHHPDLVIMDVLMPNMNGYEAASFIRQQNTDAHVPIIFLTGLSDTESLSKCLECGGDDFLTKPLNHIIFTAKLSAHARARRFSLTLRDQNKELAYFKRRTEKEQSVAERVFSKILARGQPNLPNVSVHISPMAVFSGDVYQAARAPDGALLLLLGDFTGHGLSAAIGSLPVSELFTTLVRDGSNVSTIASVLNQRMHEILPPDMFLAGAIVRYDPGNRNLSIWLGGLPHLLMTDRKGTLVNTFAPQHLPLGIVDENSFDAGVREFTLPEQGRLYLYTDGVIEATSPLDEPFGERRLIETIAAAGTANDVVQHVLGTLRDFTCQHDQQDDISFIELRDITI